MDDGWDGCVSAVGEEYVVKPVKLGLRVFPSAGYQLEGHLTAIGNPMALIRA